MLVPFLRPSLPPVKNWSPLLDVCYESRRFANFGPLHARFCAACDVRFAKEGYRSVLVANATVGLTAALVALETRGAVALPAFTFPATLQAVVAAGCEPVLCDVDPVSWELDPHRLREVLQRRPIAAVVPVRSYGFVRDLSGILGLAAEHGAQVIVDAAASFGHPRRAGAIGSDQGHVEVFSLHATKVFSIGEGGLVFAPDAVVSRIERAINFALLPDRSFGDGLNAKVDEVRCAIGLAALELIDETVELRSAMADAYLGLFSRYPRLVNVPESPGPTPWQTFPARFRTAELRREISAALAAQGIETRPYYSPAMASGYVGLAAGPFDPKETPVSERLAQEMLCFPIYESLTSDQLDYVVNKTDSLLWSVAHD